MGPSEAAMKSMKMQSTIKQNAEEMGAYLKAMQSWENDIKKRDKSISKKKQGSLARPLPPVRASGGTVPLGETATVPSQPTKKKVPNKKPAPVVQYAGGRTGEKPAVWGAVAGKSEGGAPALPLSPLDASPSSAAAHTYDKGYKKWETFDVDKALAEEDEDQGGEDPMKPGITAVSVPIEAGNSDCSDSDSVGGGGGGGHDKAKKEQTPATVIAPAVSKAGAASSKAYLPSKARAAAVARPKPALKTPAQREAEEREKGNALFKAGEFDKAARCYTACLGLANRSVAAFSNRAMCWLKLKEWTKAELDCTLALQVDPTHVKSYQRRAASRNALGLHRAALSDLNEAMEHDADGSFSKSLLIETRKTKELLKSAMRNCPRVKVRVAVAAAAAAAPPPPPPSLSGEGVAPEAAAPSVAPLKHETTRPLASSGGIKSGSGSGGSGSGSEAAASGPSAREGGEEEEEEDEEEDGAAVVVPGPAVRASAVVKLKMSSGSEPKQMTQEESTSTPNPEQGEGDKEEDEEGGGAAGSSEREALTPATLLNFRYDAEKDKGAREALEEENRRHAESQGNQQQQRPVAAGAVTAAGGGGGGGAAAATPTTPLPPPLVASPPSSSSSSSSTSAPRRPQAQQKVADPKGPFEMERLWRATSSSAAAAVPHRRPPLAASASAAAAAANTTSDSESSSGEHQEEAAAASAAATAAEAAVAAAVEKEKRRVSLKLLRPDGKVANKLFGAKAQGSTLDAEVLCDLVVSRIEAAVAASGSKKMKKKTANQKKGAKESAVGGGGNAEAEGAEEMEVPLSPGDALAQSLARLVAAPRFAQSAMFLSAAQQKRVLAALDAAAVPALEQGMDLGRAVRKPFAP